MSINFQNAVPSAFVVPQPISTSKAVLRKTLIELLPTEQTTYKPNENNIIRFNVSSNSDFLIGDESYLRFELQRTDNVAGQDQNATLDVGGIHAKFKSIEIRALQSGMLIQRYDNYNRYQSLKRMLTESAEDVEYKGQSYGDSIADRDYSAAYSSGEWEVLSFTAGSVAVSGTGVALGVGGRAMSEVKPGDIIFVQGVGAIAAFGVVFSITDDSNIVLATAAGAAIVANAANKAYVLRQRLQQSARMTAIATSNTSVTLTMKPMVSILEHALPLFIMKGGIEIKLELDLADRVYKTGVDVEDSTTANGYQISNPRYMAMMMTPHPDIVDEYVQQWKQPGGIQFYMPGVRTRRVTYSPSEANQVNLQVHPGVRSARRVYAIIQDSNIAEGSSTLSRSLDSISLCHRGNATTYQFKVGAHEFPNRDLAVNATSWEAFEQLKPISGGKFRFSPLDWQTSDRNAVKIAADTLTLPIEKFYVFTADLSRDNGFDSALSGSDISVVPLDMDLSLSASWASLGFTGSPTVYFFIEHDAYLRLASEGMLVMN
jgi:predicted MPP superfamily phosphohydrolase